MAKRKAKNTGTEIKGRAVPSFRFADLYISDASFFRRHLKPGKMPEMNGATNLTFGKVRGHPDHFGAKVSIAMEGRYEEEVSPAVGIRAIFNVVFQFSESIEHEDSLELTKIIQPETALLVSWSYWREWVQSATNRMGLPVLRIPLLNPEDAKIRLSKPTITDE